MSTDLKRRNVPFSPPDMTEREAEEVKEAILSGWITTGPRTKKLEKLVADYVGVSGGFASTGSAQAPVQKVPSCVCLNSATAAMEMVLHILGVGEGDEVIVPAYTYTASASVVSHVGATVVLVDVQPDCLEMDYDKLEAAITEKTKVVVPVDIAGIVCDYDRVREIVERKKALFQPKNDIQKLIGRVAISADCAHSFGACRKVSMVSNGFNVSNSETSGTSETLKPRMAMAGEIADFSSFSFHAVKNFTTAEGGAMTWNLPFGNEVVPQPFDNAQGKLVYCGSPVPFIEGETWNEFIYRMSQLFSLHGQNKDALAKTKLGAWEYDIIGPWYKCNMTDVVAAIGLIQFERYPEMLAKRQKYVQMYNEGIDNLNANLDANHQVAYLNHKDADHCSSHHLYMVRLVGRTREEANSVIEQMAERGIATNVHYKPLPMMTAYKALGFDIKNYPNAYNMFVNEITLPLNTKMTEEDVEYVIENFVEIVKSL